LTQIGCPYSSQILLMDRREALSLPVKKLQNPQRTKNTQAAGQQEEEPIRVHSGIDPYTGSWTDNEIIHLLRRNMFGAKKADVDFFKGMSMSAAVDFLLNSPLPTLQPPVKNYTVNPSGTTPANDPDWSVAAGQTWVDTHTNDGTVNALRRSSYKAWWMGQLINQSRSIHEKMVVFWHNHFAAETTDINNGIACYRHNLTLRQFALGNFKAFVKAITLDPAMLRYLNGEQNNKNAPDENYARELQELFTLGKGPGSQYTEADVKAAAKVLTGYRVNYTNMTSYFDANRHDTGDKTFSAFYGNKIIKGQTGANGAKELDELLDMIFAAGEVSKFIVRRLYRFFVYYKIDSAAEANVIEPLAQLFRSSNFEIKPVLATLLKSQHFFDSANQGCGIKSPLDHIAGGCREYGMVFPQNDVTNLYNMWLYLQQQAANQQQNLGDPPDVAGWKAWYQEPVYYRIWINSDTLPKRNQITDSMINNGYTRNGFTIRYDAIAFAASMPDARDPNKLMADSVKYLLGLPLSSDSMNQVKRDILLSGQADDYYWTNAWETYLANPANSMALTTVRTRLRALYQYLMNLSEYQLM